MAQSIWTSGAQLAEFIQVGLLLHTKYIGCCPHGFSKMVCFRFSPV